jgi:dihydroorotate dehydrogenase
MEKKAIRTLEEFEKHQNDKPIIGTYGVNNGAQRYVFKGANMLHTIRQIVNDDEKWRTILRGLNGSFTIKQ